MNLTPEQAIALLRDLVQERINQMGPAMQGVVGPAAHNAFSVLNEAIKPPVKEPEGSHETPSH